MADITVYTDAAQWEVPINWKNAETGAALTVPPNPETAQFSEYDTSLFLLAMSDLGDKLNIDLAGGTGTTSVTITNPDGNVNLPVNITVAAPVASPPATATFGKPRVIGADV